MLNQLDSANLPYNSETAPGACTVTLDCPGIRAFRLEAGKQRLGEIVQPAIEYYAFHIASHLLFFPIGLQYIILHCIPKLCSL